MCPADDDRNARQDFHGHERVLRQNRVFHNFDPEKAHTSQFLHPILRYYSPGVLSRSERNETASHHVLEDIYVRFRCALDSIALLPSR